jgi:phospholipid/cholesterol/gamma-HCH transport system substrate-binding protein
MQRKKAVTIGLFISLGLLIFIAGIYIVGKQQNMFGQTFKISAVFADIKGLKVGDKVLFSGIDIGTVSSIELYADTRVKTEFTIKKEVMGIIKKDSRVTIANEGLMGTKIIRILPGSDQSQPAEKDDILLSIEQVDIDDIIQKVNTSSENISMVSSNLIDITNKINRGDGIFGKIFTDTTVTRNIDRTSRNATLLSHNLVVISDKVNKGYGILGKVFTDTVFSRQLDTASHNLKLASGNFAEITAKVNAGEGIFGRLFTDTTLTHNLYLTSVNLERATRDLALFSQKLNDNENALSKLVADTAFADSLEIILTRLNACIVELTKASEAVQRSGMIRMFSKDKENK